MVRNALKQSEKWAICGHGKLKVEPDRYYTPGHQLKLVYTCPKCGKKQSDKQLRNYWKEK